MDTGEIKHLRWRGARQRVHNLTGVSRSSIMCQDQLLGDRAFQILADESLSSEVRKAESKRCCVIFLLLSLLFAIWCFKKSLCSPLDLRNLCSIFKSRWWGSHVSCFLGLSGQLDCWLGRRYPCFVAACINQVSHAGSTGAACLRPAIRLLNLALVCTSTELFCAKVDFMWFMLFCAKVDFGDVSRTHICLVCPTQTSCLPTLLLVLRLLVIALCTCMYSFPWKLVAFVLTNMQLAVQYMWPLRKRVSCIATCSVSCIATCKFWGLASHVGLGCHITSGHWPVIHGSKFWAFVL